MIDEVIDFILKLFNFAHMLPVSLKTTASHLKKHINYSIRLYFNRLYFTSIIVDLHQVIDLLSGTPAHAVCRGQLAVATLERFGQIVHPSCVLVLCK